MNPMDELKDEHRGVEEALRILENICARIEERLGASDPDHIAQLLEFFSVFVDTCHHGKEEELLFPALEAAGVSRRGGPIGVMLAEHEMGRGHIRGMRSALTGLRQQDAGAGADFLLHARGYIELLRRHIEKEDGVLFRIAAERLTVETKQDLAAGFERIEEEKVGHGKHEAFHRMLAELGRIYA